MTYRLRSAEANRDTIERVHAMHHGFCPVYRTLESAIEITTEYRLEDDA